MTTEEIINNAIQEVKNDLNLDYWLDALNILRSVQVRLDGREQSYSSVAEYLETRNKLGEYDKPIYSRI